MIGYQTSPCGQWAALSNLSTTMLRSHFLLIEADLVAFWMEQYLFVLQSAIRGNNFLVSRPAQNHVLKFLEKEGNNWRSWHTAFITPMYRCVSLLGPQNGYLDIASGVSCLTPGRCATA